MLTCTNKICFRLMQLGLHASKEINANIRRLINSCAAEPPSMGLLHVLCLRAWAVIIGGTRPPNILVGGSKGKFPPPLIVHLVKALVWLTPKCLLKWRIKGVLYYQNSISFQLQGAMSSVLWRCWFGGRKGIWPVKNWVVGCWRGYLSGARCRLAYGPADATATHCLLLQ